MLLYQKQIQTLRHQRSNFIVMLIMMASFQYHVVIAQGVGIGTTTPYGALQINQASNTAPGLILMDSFHLGDQQFRNINTPSMFGIRGFLGSYLSSEKYLDFYTDSLLIATFKGNGNFGINSPDPKSRLEVTSNSVFGTNHHQLMLVESDNDFARMSFKNENGMSFHIAGYKGTMANGSQDRLNFYSPAIAQDVMSLSGDGDVTFHRAFKPNNNAGQAGQILQSNGPNAAPSWVSANGCFQNLVKFVGPTTTNIASSNLWTVPANIYKIYVEMWGGGGGGHEVGVISSKGGGGAGCAAAYFDVSPGQTINFLVGGRGNYANYSNNAEAGGTTSVTINATSLSAYGGSGAQPNAIGRGGVATVGPSSYPAILVRGEDGKAAKKEFYEHSANEKYSYYFGAYGGNAGNTSNTRAIESNSSSLYDGTSWIFLEGGMASDASIPGGGGVYFRDAAPGMVLIHY